MSSPNIEDIILDVFKAADASGKAGTLNVDEFLQAYNVLYNRFVNDLGGSGATAEAVEENFVQATRYGYLGNDSSDDRRYIFEVYVGTMSNIDKLYVFDLPNVDDTQVASASATHELNDINIFDIPTIFPDGKPLTGYNLETINRLILEDSERNSRTHSRVMWWVDVSSVKCRSSEINAVIKAFGIPEEVRNNFLTLEAEEKFVSVGKGEVVCDGLRGVPSYLGQTTVFSSFVELLHIHNKPMVPRDPEWFSVLPAPWILEIGKYASSRLCIFYDFSRVKCMERKKLMHVAYAASTELLDHHHPHGDGDEQQSAAHKKNSLLQPIKLPKLSPLEGLEKNFLLSAYDMHLRKPELSRLTLSLHIQDQGYGPCALITFRRIDSEMKVDGDTTNLMQKAHSGVLGRALVGVWNKLLEVTAHEGIANIGAELDDSPFSLSMFIMSIVHNLSMDTVQSLELWLQRIAHEIESMAVTKHGKHIEKFDGFVRIIKEYVEAFNGSVEPLLKHMPSDMHLAHLAAVAAKAKKAPAVFNKDTWAPETRKRAADVYAATASLVSTSVKTDIEDLNPLDHFATNGTSVLCRDLLNGIEKLEKKGSKYWLEQLIKFEEGSERLKERYQMTLDEKRNFWGFTLGLVTIVTFPFAVMTGYFGMNFENMAEPGEILTNEFLPAFPGQYMIWFFTLIIYGAMFLLFLHFKIIQSAL